MDQQGNNPLEEYDWLTLELTAHFLYKGDWTTRDNVCNGCAYGMNSIANLISIEFILVKVFVCRILSNLMMNRLLLRERISHAQS